MNETKHTPGPWYTMGGSQPQIASEADPSGRTLALVYTNGADARLIAAAPDLLAELKTARKCIANILDNCPYFFPDRGDSSLLSDEQKKWRKTAQVASRTARAAIAQAEGGGE